MIEDQLDGELQQTLHRAVNRTVQLYHGEHLAVLTGHIANTKERGDLWNDVAHEFPAFEHRIKDLGRAMMIVKEAKEPWYGTPTLQELTVPFLKVKNEDARRYLGDVLLSRLIISKGHMDRGIKWEDEVKEMATELGLQKGWQSDEAVVITLDKAVGATLTGTLSITHQAIPPSGQPPHRAT